MMIIQSPPSFPVRDVCLPTVYDALLVIRGTCNFRDGRVIKNCMGATSQYFIQLAFNDAYHKALIHLIPTNYSETLHWLYQSRNVLKRCCTALASVFLLIKSYASSLLGELSQLCYKAILRTIALGSTQCLSTWRSCTLIGLQAIHVVVGRIALGRIFNVVGSIIDRYMELIINCQFNTTKLYEAFLVLALGSINQQSRLKIHLFFVVSFRQLV